METAWNIVGIIHTLGIDPGGGGGDLSGGNKRRARIRNVVLEVFETC